MQLRRLVHATLGAASVAVLMAVPLQASAFCPASVSDIELGEPSVVEELSFAAFESLGTDATRSQCRRSCTVAHNGCQQIKNALRRCNASSDQADSGFGSVFCQSEFTGSDKQECNQDNRAAAQDRREELNDEAQSATQACRDAKSDCFDACNSD
jgi:hypothetical protein